jgi:NAD(P)-dependent dehydrogenase (short-subunit alcohol dehydrogenase family)
MLKRLWRGLKVSRKINLGPVSMLYRFDRTVKISAGIDRLHARSSDVAVPEAASGRAPTPRQLAIIVGVGQGFGHALARRLAADGFNIVLVSRNASRLEGLVDELHDLGADVEAYGADATDETAVQQLFDHTLSRYGVPALVVYAVQYFGPGAASEVEVPAFEAAWRHNCLGAFLVAKRAATEMLRKGSGTIALVGSTSSIVGRAEHLNLAVGKFGQRALAQVMARELWPKGIHVAHVIIDADIFEPDDPQKSAQQADPAHIADAVLTLHRQPKTAWTSELDLRPWNEVFWQHC